MLSILLWLADTSILDVLVWCRVVKAFKGGLVKRHQDITDGVLVRVDCYCPGDVKVASTMFSLDKIHGRQRRWKGANKIQERSKGACRCSWYRMTACPALSGQKAVKRKRHRKDDVTLRWKWVERDRGTDPMNHEDGCHGLEKFQTSMTTC